MVNGLRIVAIIVAIWVGYIVLKHVSAREVSHLQAIASTFAAIAGTLLGFVVAALSILAAIINRELVTQLRRTGHYRVLLHDLYLTAATYLLTVIVSLASLFFTGEWVLWAVVFATGVMTLATLFLAVAGYRFSLVIRHVS